MSENIGGDPGSGDLDPRIQVELENLNTATDEINKLEIELEEANTTFNILMNESTRRLKLLIKKLGNCIEKARPYYDALEKSREAQIECQKAAVKFQRANEIHAAAKETVALAEQRFMSNSHEWQFDNAWQEMLNHATQKVMDAEIKKAEHHAEHQKKAQIFNAAEMKVQQLEERYRRSIQKSRPYFEEKQICTDQLQTQKNRILELKGQVAAAKQTYSTALRKLEEISEEIHKQRGDIVVSGSPSNYPNGCLPVNRPPPPGPREPGVGAELSLDFNLDLDKFSNSSIIGGGGGGCGSSIGTCGSNSSNDGSPIIDCDDLPSMTDSEYSLNAAIDQAIIIPNKLDNEQQNINFYNKNNIIINNKNDLDYSNIDNNINNDKIINDNLNVIDLEEKLRKKFKTLAVRPVEGGDGCQEKQDNWEMELNATVDKLDHLMMMKECAAASSVTTNTTTTITATATAIAINSTPTTPIITSTTKTTTSTNHHYLKHHNHHHHYHHQQHHNNTNMVAKKSQETQTPTKLNNSSSVGNVRDNFIINQNSLTIKPHLLLQNKFYLLNDNKINQIKSNISPATIISSTTTKITPTATKALTAAAAVAATLIVTPPQSNSIDHLNVTNSMPSTPEKISAIKHLKKLEPLPSVNVSMRELPLLAGLSTEVLDRGIGYTKQRRRSLE